MALSTAITHQQMRLNLQAARRSATVNITPERQQFIRDMLKQGMSKKALCKVYGLSYAELKQIKLG